MAKTLDRYYRIIRKPRVTEKGLKAVEHARAYPFEVHPLANKIEIRKAIETLFDVKVLHVRTMTRHGKWKRRGRHVFQESSWKRAVVTLAEGHTVEFL